MFTKGTLGHENILLRKIFRVSLITSEEADKLGSAFSSGGFFGSTSQIYFAQSVRSEIETNGELG